MEVDPSKYWIVKPASSSQGRGIYLANSFSQIQDKHEMIVSTYISNPLTINGLKFDLRLYVVVTCLHPLRIYIYEDGLVRFATELYQSPEVDQSKFAHLTNYSINKASAKFVQTGS